MTKYLELLKAVVPKLSRVGVLVNPDNVAALALYRPFGFAPVYDYWYRGPPESPDEPKHR